jgi:hypothetical protein
MHCGPSLGVLVRAYTYHEEMFASGQTVTLSGILEERKYSGLERIHK